MSISTPFESVTEIKFYDDLLLAEIPSIPDGSCFFHSVLRATNKKYIEAKTLDERSKMGEQLRSTLSELITDINPKTRSRFYDELSRGQLSDLAKEVPLLSTTNLEKHLDSKEPVGLEVLEFVSNTLDKDIYILDKITLKLYLLGDSELLYQGRNSIIISYNGCHYNTLGLKNSNGNIDTLFKPTNNLIIKLREYAFVNSKK